MRADTSPDQSGHLAYHLVGIGGSGMMSLAVLLVAAGHRVTGSDRGHDQGRTPERFAAIAAHGIALFPQDGSGVTDPAQIIVASAAVEAQVPDIARAAALGCRRMTRAELNAALFNAAATPIGIAGTSGKSTVTAMIGHILSRAGRDPTIMNGAGMVGFAGASAVSGHGSAHVSEIDESDGSIALYRPAVGVLLNCTLDHKPMDELRGLFRDFAAASRAVAWNADDRELAPLVGGHGKQVPFGFSAAAEPGVRGHDATLANDGDDIRATARVTAGGAEAALRLAVPGRHNLANALAAIAAVGFVGIDLAAACAALAGYRGIARRFQTVGRAGGVTVIDDFAHNPDKLAATMAVLAGAPGRRHWFFQPHGYGPLAKMAPELADAFIAGMGETDTLHLCDPVYFGGTVDRSVGSAAVTDRVRGAGRDAHHLPAREDCAEAIARLARTGDTIVVMGARDDTLPAFAAGILDRLTCQTGPDRA